MPKSEIVYSREFNFVYVAIPKAASRVMLDVLHRRPLQPMGTKMKTTNFDSFLLSSAGAGDWLARARIFTVMRDPFTRLAAAYCDKLDGDRKKWRAVGAGKLGLWKGIAFHDFVHIIARTPDEELDRHFCSQRAFLGPGPITIEILQQEKLPQHLTHLWHSLGLPPLALPPELPIVNSNEARGNIPAGGYEALYTDNLRKIVEKRFADDFRLLSVLNREKERP